MSKTFCWLLILVLSVSSCAVVSKNALAEASSAVPNMWVAKAPMDIGKSYFGAAVVNNKIYVIGGCDEEAWGGNELMPASSHSGGVVGMNEAYEPSTNNWTAEAPMPTPREQIATAVYQNQIYCIGGAHGGVHGENEVYDPSTNTWKTRAPMPYPTLDMQANVVDGKIYCIDGTTTEDGNVMAINQVYDPVANTWSTKTPPPHSTYDYASAVFDGKIYIINGINWYSDEALDLTQIYNPQNDSWSIGAPPPYADLNVGVATSGVMAPERIYTFGSYTQIYNPFNNSWSLGAPFSLYEKYGVSGFSVTNVNDQLYVMGGVSYTGDMNAEIASETEYNLNEQYTPVGYGTPDPSYVLAHTLPKISIISPVNQTYRNRSVPLNFTVDKAVNWLGYSLDGQQNITIIDNNTLTGLSSGEHNITVYANDTYGNMGASQTISFTIAKPFPTALVTAASAASVVIIGIGLLFYFKKRNKH